MASRNDVVYTVLGQYPESLLSLDFSQKVSLLSMPHFESLVLSRTDDESAQLLPEHDATDIVGVAVDSVVLPALVVVVLPEFDLAVISCRDDEVVALVEVHPVDSPVVSLQHELDLHLPLLLHLALTLLEVLVPQVLVVPHSDLLVQAGRDYQVLVGVELGAHDVVAVACEDAHLGPVLVIPDPDGLVIGGGEDPGEFGVELDGADVVDVSGEGEETLLLAVVPALDLVVVPPRDEEGLGEVEVDSPDGTLVLFELVYHLFDAVVPQLDDSVVQTHQ